MRGMRRNAKFMRQLKNDIRQSAVAADGRVRIFGYVLPAICG
jgi:hypothetical protein